MERVLLIGGTGFIGSHLVEACLSSGMHVRIVGRTANANASHAAVEYIRGDYGDIELLPRILDGIDMVVHLAHHNLAASRNCDMEADFDQNTRPVIRLMDACCTRHVKRLLFVSSGGAIYGNTRNSGVITEESETLPISVYGTSKLITERIGFLYRLQRDLPFVVARPANAYGPGQRPYRGQGFIATAIASAIQGKKLQIFGDGTSVRDYIHAADIGAALVALLREGHIGEAYNVGTGYGVSLRELLDQYLVPIVHEAGLALDVEYLPPRAVDVSYNVLSTKKLQTTTGFKPKIAFKEGLRETLIWLRSELHR
jgi:UDP-glucose 4-epimerase